MLVLIHRLLLHRNDNEAKHELSFTFEDRLTKTFRHIIYNTTDVLVGPLEYCGNANILSHGGHKL